MHHITTTWICKHHRSRINTSMAESEANARKATTKKSAPRRLCTPGAPPSCDEGGCMHYVTSNAEENFAGATMTSAEDFKFDSSSMERERDALCEGGSMYHDYARRAPRLPATHTHVRRRARDVSPTPGFLIRVVHRIRPNGVSYSCCSSYTSKCGSLFVLLIIHVQMGFRSSVAGNTRPNGVSYSCC